MTREREIRAEGVKLLRALGCRVYTFSEPRPARVTPGVPDMYAFLPQGRGVFWWEAKAKGGIISDGQAEFERRCLACGQPYVRGGLVELRHFLAGLGIVDAALSGQHPNISFRAALGGCFRCGHTGFVPSKMTGNLACQRCGWVRV